MESARPWVEVDAPGEGESSCVRDGAGGTSRSLDVSHAAEEIISGCADIHQKKARGFEERAELFLVLDIVYFMKAGYIGFAVLDLSVEFFWYL